MKSENNIKDIDIERGYKTNLHLNWLIKTEHFILLFFFETNSH